VAVRLILFDIDGTLVRGGAARRAFQIGLEHAYGTAGAIDAHDFSGTTDPQIARELLSGAGLDHARVDAGLPALWERYLSELEARISGEPYTALPGVTGLLDALEASGTVALGLVTGNVLGGARLKLGSVGLYERFRVGGYGSDDEIRDHLPGIAIARARAAWGIDFAKDDVWVVGDTPLDVACGRHEGVRTMAVATGRHPTDELTACGADVVVESFAALEPALERLLG
jgi:phosphoglycolate phosphatase-like HAD superfamily hydrolase